MNEPITKRIGRVEFFIDDAATFYRWIPNLGVQVSLTHVAILFWRWTVGVMIVPPEEEYFKPSGEDWP